MDWKAFLAEIEGNTNHLAKDIPATMKGFAQMDAAAKTDGALSEKTKEFIAPPSRPAATVVSVFMCAHWCGLARRLTN